MITMPTVSYDNEAQESRTDDYETYIISDYDQVGQVIETKHKAMDVSKASKFAK